MESGCALIFTSTDDKEKARGIASYLIGKKLAACVHIDEIESFFEWNGRTENIVEFRLIIKAESKNYGNIEKSILEKHNYELPEILKIDISAGFPAYLKWIKGGETS